MMIVSNSYRVPEIVPAHNEGYSPWATRELRRAMIRAMDAAGGDGSPVHKATVDLRVVMEHHDRGESATPYLDRTEPKCESRYVIAINAGSWASPQLIVQCDLPRHHTFATSHHAKVGPEKDAADVTWNSR